MNYCQAFVPSTPFFPSSTSLPSSSCSPFILPSRSLPLHHPRDKSVRHTHVKRPVIVSSLKPTIPVKSEAAQKSYVLQEWLVENGMYLSPEASWGQAKHPLAIANDTTDDGENSGRGLVATKGILQGECLFEVPMTVVLTKEVALKKFPVLDAEVNEYVAIAILLISERYIKGVASFYSPYIDILPSDEELIPLFRWTDDDKQLLAGSPTLAAAESLANKLRAEYGFADETIFQPHREVFPADVFTYESWEWAFAILFSRAISLTKEGIIALVPYADLLNHNPYCANYIDVHSELLSGDRFVRLYTDRPYAFTDQVFVTYGPKPNADLLLLYGFVSDGNPYDSVELNVSLSEEDPLYDEKLDYLNQSGVEETASFPLYRDRYPMEMVEFLRFCFATEEEFETADFGSFISEQNETLVARAIVSGCQDALDKYPQTREEDDKIMEDVAMFQMLSMKQRWAVRQRRAEKRILQRTITTIESEMVDPRFMFTE